LAAGTGKLTGELATRFARVIAIEPLEEMRAELSRSLPDVETLPGSAEDIPLPDASADAVLVAQAFHWFDGPRALSEIARVLRPGGVLALVFNARRTEDAIHRRIDALLAPHRGDTPAHATGDWHAAIETSELFGPLATRT